MELLKYAIINWWLEYRKWDTCIRLYWISEDCNYNRLPFKLIKRAQDQIQIHKNAKKSNSILFTTYIYTQSSRPDEDSIVGTSRAKIAPIVALFKYQTGRIKAGETRVTSLRHKTKQTAAQSYSIQLLQIRHWIYMYTIRNSLITHQL